MNNKLALTTCVGVALIAAACGSSASKPADGASEPPQPDITVQDETSQDDSSDEQNASTTSGGALTLDYTAYIPGAIQPSGLGVSPDASTAALVTDFERVVVVDIATQQPTADFGVGRNELPRQGATEAIAFLDDTRLAVLYPDDHVVGIFDLEGSLLAEVELDIDERVDGAMTVIGANLAVLSRTDAGAELQLVDPETGDALAVPIVDDIEPLEGLSPSEDVDVLLGVTAAGDIHQIDVSSGTVTTVGQVAEVDDPSGLEVFRNESEDEVQIGVTDDADAYNSEPSPLRLFLA